jgi:hypothetical protein
VALVAIIRKLMTAVYSVAKHRRPFVLSPIFSPASGGRGGSGYSVMVNEIRAFEAKFN